MNVLVSGGAGFLGSWFCDILNSRGANIICVDNLISGSKKNIEHLESKKNFKFIKDDITNLVLLNEIDYIVHMASIASPLLYLEHPIKTLDANVFATRYMLEIAKEKKVKGFLFTSTSEIYGNPPNKMIPTPETYSGMVNTTSTRAMYDEGKRVAETYCHYYWKKHGVPVRIARIFNTYGPRMDTNLTPSYGRALVNFIKQAKANKPITVFGDGKQTRSFCYVTDTIKGLSELLFTGGLGGEIVNIGNDEEISILNLAKKITEITNSKSSIMLYSEPKNYNMKDDPKRRCPDLAKARKLLNYKPEVSLDDGLRRMIK